ncbi:MAG TPA: cellulase family glycosylhydrolase [Thermomicrobiales bacterium]|jgi:endoglucanase
MAAQTALPRWRGFNLLGFVTRHRPGPVRRSIMAAQSVLPRWRGFNLLELYTRYGRADWRTGAFPEDDFRWIADWGFDFVRIPLDYTLWIADGDIYKIHEATLEQLDRVVRLGERYGLHVCFNFHAAPGYCVNPKDEPFNLWKDQEALDAFCFHWGVFADRYKGIDAKRVSFDLVNEPRVPYEHGSREDYERVVRAAVATIRARDPQRLIIADGIRIGREPAPELNDLGIAQSCRGYEPAGVSHYRASWVEGSETWPTPTWPQPASHPGGASDRAALEAFYAPWIALARQGIGVHCGEAGTHENTPHAVTLAWLEDLLDILTKEHIGYALWNFRGQFGILDAKRTDVDFEDWHGHNLDRKMLELLQRY